MEIKDKRRAYLAAVVLGAAIIGFVLGYLNLEHNSVRLDWPQTIPAAIALLASLTAILLRPRSKSTSGFVLAAILAVVLLWQSVTAYEASSENVVLVYLVCNPLLALCALVALTLMAITPASTPERAR